QRPGAPGAPAMAPSAPEDLGPDVDRGFGSAVIGVLGWGIGRMIMLRRWLGASDPRNPSHLDRSASRDGQRVRLTVLSWAQAGFLGVLILALVVVTREPAPDGHESPTWSIPTGHVGGVHAVAFTPDGRKLATGGEDGSVVLWELCQGAETELRKESSW